MGLLDRLRAQDEPQRPLSLLDRLRQEDQNGTDEWEPFGHLLRNRRTGQTKPADKPWWASEPEPEQQPRVAPQLAERARELQAMGAMPALGREELPPDPGVVKPALRRAADAAAGWTVGLAERGGDVVRSHPALGMMSGANVLAAVEPGTRQAMLGNLEEERAASLLHGNANARALALGGAELAGGAAGGAIPGLQIGRGIATATRAGQIASPVGRALAGAGASAVEGVTQGLGETAGAPISDQMRGAALGGGLAALAGLGGALGSAARIKAARAAVDNPAPPPKIRLSAEVVAKYQQERAAAMAEVASQLASSQAQGRSVSPEALSTMQGMRLRQLDAVWHGKLAEAARLLDEPAIHSLADETENAVVTQVDAPPATERRSNASLRAEVDAILPRLRNLPDAELRQLMDSNPGEATERAIERTMFHRAAGTASGPPRARIGAPAETLDSSAVIRYGPDPKEPVGVQLRKLADRWVDEMSNKEEAPVRFLRRAGLGAEAASLEKMIGRARGAGRIAANTIWKGVYRYDPTTNNVTRTHDSYASIVGGLDGQAYRDLNDLMAAQHHMELVGRLDAARAEQATMGAGGIAMAPPDAALKIDERGTAVAQRTLADLAQRYGMDPDPATGGAQVRTLAGIAERVRAWSTAAVIDQLDSVGYFTPEAKAALLAKNREYAPFFRLLDDLAEDPVLAGGSSTQPVKRISGGLSPDKPIAPPTESFVAQAQRVAVWVERQRVRNLLGDFAEAHPETIGKEIKRAASGKGSVQVFRDGQRVEYSAPSDVVAALERMPPKQANLFMQSATLAARFLRAGATLTPDFAVRNLLRDQATAGAYGAEFKYRPFADFAVGLWAQTPMGGKLKEYAANWEASGGALSDYISIERPDVRMTADAAAGLVRLPFLKQPVRAPRLARTWADWKAEKGLLAKIVFPALRPLEGASSAIEQATRIGAFRRAKLGGADDLTAGNYSRNISLDFGRSGSFGQRWNSVEAFANASLQDVARFSRAMRDRPVATSLAAASYITAPALATWAMHKDDPDYQNLPEWEKASFLHLTKRDDGRWVRFPRPLGMLNLVYGYGVQKMLEQASGQGAEEPVNDLLTTIFQETPLRFSPLQPDPGPGGNFAGSAEALPNIAQPAVETWANLSSFRRAPIVPAGLEGVLPEDRALDSTSELARVAGRTLGVSPLKIDHLIRGYGAGLTVETLATAERLAGAPQQPVLPATAKDVPGVSGLVSSSPYGFASQPVQDFYALERAAANAAGSLKQARDAGRAQEYHRILREHPEALLADPLADVSKQLRDLRAARKLYRGAEEMTPEYRAEVLLQIDQAVTQIAAGNMHMASDYLRGMRD